MQMPLFDGLSTDPNRTARNKVESPLLWLPGESRNQIYHYASGGFVIFVNCSSYEDDVHAKVNLELRLVKPADDATNPTDSDDYIPNNQNRPKDPAFRLAKQYLPHHPSYAVSTIYNLQSLCRQTRAETNNLDPYRDNIFSFEHPRPAFSSFTLSLQRTKPPSPA
jgi:hypothetical protein